MSSAATSAKLESTCLRLEHLFREHERSLLRTVLRIVGCRQTTEDVLQDTYIRVTEAARERRISYPQPFLYQTAKNIALDYLRRERVRRRALVNEAVERTFHVGPSPTPLPETVVANRQEVTRLSRLLADLPKRRRHILILHKVHGWRYAEIAAHVGISESAVEKNVRSAMAYCLARMREDADR